MNSNLRFYKGLVDLLESHIDECRLPQRGEREVSEADFLSKILKKAGHNDQPQLSRKCEIQVFCSVIHLSSAIVFLLAQHDLRDWLNLEINFSQSSSVAVEGFKRATIEKRPALVTVTDGTANVLSESSLGSWQFMTTPPVALKLASIGNLEDFRATDLRRFQYTVINHPTDLNIFQNFARKHFAKYEKPAELLLINEAPESIEVLSQAKRDQVLLVNPHMAHWANASVNGLKPMSFLRGWQVVENRFIFGNSFFAALMDRSKAYVAKWLYLYLEDKFDNLRGQKSDFVTNTRIGKGAFTDLVRTEYFKL